MGRVSSCKTNATSITAFCTSELFNAADEVTSPCRIISPILNDHQNGTTWRLVEIRLQAVLSKQSRYSGRSKFLLRVSLRGFFSNYSLLTLLPSSFHSQRAERSRGAWSVSFAHPSKRHERSPIFSLRQAGLGVAGWSLTINYDHRHSIRLSSVSGTLPPSCSVCGGRRWINPNIRTSHNTRRSLIFVSFKVEINHYLSVGDISIHMAQTLAVESDTDG